jgi:LTXXQ motif family protein
VRTTAGIGLIALAALFAADEACAQIGGGGFPGGGSAGRRGGIRGGTERQQPRTQDEPRQDVFQTTLEELRIDLKLDAAQQQAWNTYAEKLVALMSDVARERARKQPGVAPAAPQTAPQQLDQLVITAQNRATAVEEVATAAKSLYGMLSPEQKSIADGRLANVSSLAAAPRPDPVRTNRQP